MNNRAKCKKCNTIIESFHPGDYVTCSCGEISVDGGIAMRCAAVDWANFLRVDDEGNELVVKAIEADSEDPFSKELPQTPHKQQLLEMLKDMVRNIEKLPPHAMSNPINHYDFESLLVLLVALFTDDCKPVI